MLVSSVYLLVGPLTVDKFAWTITRNEWQVDPKNNEGKWAGPNSDGTSLIKMPAKDLKGNFMHDFTTDTNILVGE